MGAICGVFERSGQATLPDRLAAMESALQRRAPLEAGSTSHGSLGLAARALDKAAARD